MRCSHCETDNPADYSFCSNCGELIYVETETVIRAKPLNPNPQSDSNLIRRDIATLIVIGIVAFAVVGIVTVLFHELK